MIKFYKALFENSTDQELTMEGYISLKKLIVKFNGLDRAVNMNEMEQIANIGNRSPGEGETEKKKKGPMREKLDEHRLDLIKKVNMKKFKDDSRKYGLMEAVKLRFYSFARLCHNNRISRALLDKAGNNPFIIKVLISRV